MCVSACAPLGVCVCVCVCVDGLAPDEPLREMRLTFFTQKDGHLHLRVLVCLYVNGTEYTWV